LIGATNRVDLLDEALIRPGRIDKKIKIGNPDDETREKLINIYIKNKPLHPDIKIDNLVHMTSGFSCAEVENFINEVMLYVLRDNRELILFDDIQKIQNRMLTGYQSTQNKLSSAMLKQVAIHEIGHALTSIFIKYKKISRVSINLWSPTSLGFTLFEESDLDLKAITKNNLIKEIMVLLGGRVAEEIFYSGKISSGAFEDINRVKKIIYSMVVDYGMGTQIFIPSNSEINKYKIDIEINTLYQKAYDNTKFILENSKHLIDELSDDLITKNQLNYKELYAKVIDNTLYNNFVLFENIIE